MRRALEVTQYTVALVCFLLATASTVDAQEGAERKKAELTKEINDLLEMRGLEKPAQGVAMYLRHLMNDKKEKAYDLIDTREAAKRFIDKSADLKYLKANSADLNSVDFVGFRMISTTIISFLYVMTTRDGPVAVRVDTFSFKTKLHVAQISITRKWDDLMKMADGVQLLPASMEIKFNARTE